MNAFDYISVNLISSGVTTSYVVPRRAIYIFWRKGFWLCRDYFFDKFIPALESLCQSAHFLGRVSKDYLDQNCGKIIINHDHKCIIDDNRYGDLFSIPAGWVSEFFANRDDSYVGDILDLDGFKGLVDSRMLTLHKVTPLGKMPVQEFSSIDDLRVFLDDVSENESVDRYWVSFNTPCTWSIIS